MPEGTYIGFDFGYSKIGVAVGQQLTQSASPLPLLKATRGTPDWSHIQILVKQWRPVGFIVGLPTCIDGTEQHTTAASRRFASELQARFSLPVHMVDERLSTIEARAHLFAQGGYHKIKKTAVDSIAACIILEQWLQRSS